MVLQSQFLHKESIRPINRWKLQGRATWNVEVDSKVGPLALLCLRDILHCGYMEGHEGLSIHRDQDSVMGAVNIKLTSFEVLRDLAFILIRLDVAHLLHFLFLSCSSDFTILESQLEFLEFLI